MMGQALIPAHQPIKLCQVERPVTSTEGESDSTLVFCAHIM
jgi:hypothetical protein